MNPAIGALVGVSKQTEMLLMTVLALWVNIFDMAIFEISSNLDQVWNVEIDNKIFNPNAEYLVRMFLSGVVLIRTFTLHLYIAFLIAVFWPVCFGTRPTLMLPWLVVSAMKNLGTGLVSVGTGGYTCMIYGPLRPACLRFLLSQLIDLSPSFYMWFVGLSLYCDLKKPKSVNKLQVKAMEDQELNMALRRRKVKSMIDEDILRQQFESRSLQKKFLGTSAVEVNEIINSSSYDNFKKKFSRSLDSLLDVLTVQTELLDNEDSEPLEIDNSTTLEQKTAKLLGISLDEIDYIKQNRQTRIDFTVHPVQHQKKSQAISAVNSRYESSATAKLLPETSLYSPPNVKPIRVTKSELKSGKDFKNIEPEFMQTVPEKEIKVHDLMQRESFESFTKMQMETMYQASSSSFKFDVANDVVSMGSTNFLSKKPSVSKEHGWEHSYKKRNTYSRKQDVPIRVPTKYKFSNTMSDKSRYLLDDHSFLFDKESILMKKEQSKIVLLSGYANRKRSIDENQNQNQNQKPSKEKQRRLNAPTIDVASNTNTVIFMDNVLINKTSLDEKFKDNNNKPSLENIKEYLINKNHLKPAEKNQKVKNQLAFTRKMPSNHYSNIPVSHRDIKCKNRYFVFKNKVAVAAKTLIDNVNNNQKASGSQENKLYTIEENINITPVNNSHEEENNDHHVNKMAEENKLITNEKVKNASLVFNQEEKNKNNIFLLKKNNAIPADKSKISVTAEIEKINQKTLKVLSKKDLFQFVENKTNSNNNNNNNNNNNLEIIDKKNYIRSVELGIPVPFRFVKHSAMRMIPFPKEAINQEENKSLFSNTMFKTSENFSDKIMQILREKNKPKTEKTSVVDIFETKINNTETFQSIKHNEFKFTAKIKEKEMNFPSVKSPFKSNQLEFHLKEKFTKIKDNRVEDLFKKKIASERKDSKMSDKEKLGFPSYFSNKINRIITDACQIRKKSCKKINLFIKVPINKSLKQRNKLSTIELFRKQSPAKANLFEITSELEYPTYKEDKCPDTEYNLNKNKKISNSVEITLFDTKETKRKNTPPVHVQFSSQIPTFQYSSKICHFDDNTIKRTDGVQFSSKEKINGIDEAQFSLPFAKKDIKNDDAKCVEDTTIPQKSSLPVILENRKCKTLVEQAMNKIMFITKSDYSTKVKEINMNIRASNSCSNIAVKNYNCKRLSEQAINKIISITNMEYTHFSNNGKFKTHETDSKLNASMVHEANNCRKLSDFALNKLLSITSPKCTSNTSIINKNSTCSIVVPKTKIEKKEEIIERKTVLLSRKHSGIPINICKSENLRHTISNASSQEKDLNDFSKALKATQSEKNNSLHLNESRTKVNRKSSIPVMKEYMTVYQKSPSITKLENNNEMKCVCVDNGCSSNAINKSVSNMDISIRNNSKEAFAHPVKLIASTNNIFLINSNPNIVANIPMPVENRNIPVIVAEIKNCNEVFKQDSSIIIEDSINTTHSPSNETMLTKKNQQEVDINCKWTNQNSISFTSSNTSLYITLPTETISTSEENQYIPNSKKDMSVSPKEENLNQSATKQEIECNASSSEKIDSHYNDEAMLTTEVLQTNPIKRKEKICNWTSQDCIELIHSNEEKISISEMEHQNLLCPTPQREEIICKEKIEATATATATASTNISLNNEEKDNKDISQNINTEYKVNIPMVKVEKECKGTSQHRIKLISSTDINNRKRSENIEELIDKNKSNVDKLFSSACNDFNDQALKEIKICKGTSQHNIRLISSIRNDSSSEKNVCHSETILSEIKTDKYISLNEQKVFKGSSQNFVKLISANKEEEFASSKNVSHQESLSNILKEYQPVPIMKEEKVCKGTSKHKIKLISSYMKDLSNKNNLFHRETEYKNNKNKNTTIILKEEKNCKGTLQQISSTKNDSPSNKTNVIAKEQLPKWKDTIEEECKDNVQTPSLKNNLFTNWKQNFTVIQKQKNDKESAQSSAKQKVNLFVKDKMTNTDNTKINKKLVENNLDEYYHNIESVREMTLLSTIQDFLEIDNHPLSDVKSSEILSSLIQKVETSIKLQDSNKEDLCESETRKCCKYLNNQMHVGCQTSTLSKKVLEFNELTKNTSKTKLNTKSSSVKSYQDLNSQRIAFSTSKNNSSKLEIRPNNDNIPADEKKESIITLNSHNSRNSSYVSIYKERLEKAKLVLNKSVIIQNCTLLEDGYTRLYNLLGVKQENFDIKTHKTKDSSINF